MWTKERIEKLTPAEVKNLKQNALDRGNEEVAALCDQVTAEKPKKVVTRTVKPKTVKKKVEPKVDPDSE
ncbi:MAG: hypothetical protein ABIQ72_16205 [Usitatibacter sp.]